MKIKQFEIILQSKERGFHLVTDEIFGLKFFFMLVNFFVLFSISASFLSIVSLVGFLTSSSNKS